MKLFAIIFSIHIFILSLAPNMKGIEFLKMGNLLEHYYQHLERNDNSSWIDFISEHYFATSVDYDKEHQEMPFKHSANAAPTVFVELKSAISFVKEPFLEEKIVQKPISVESRYYYNSIYSIWNPPRI